MKRKIIKERFLTEGVLDTVFKGILGTYFGSKLLDAAARRDAMGDKKVQKHLKDLQKSLDGFDATMAKYKKAH